MTTSPARKDTEAEQPIPLAWRPTIEAIVIAFVELDYGLARGVSGVRPPDQSSVDQIAGYIADYGASLVELPSTTWETSLCQWTGSKWDLLIDLWTAEEGRSDMVLTLSVEESDELLFTVHMVYVP